MSRSVTTVAMMQKVPGHRREIAVPSGHVEGGTCPLCSAPVSQRLGEHLRREHGEEVFRNAVLRAKEGGMPDAEIGARYGVSFSKLEEIITEAYGANISVLKAPKRLKKLVPSNFEEETSTVWSFRRRGNWATHDGRYRGNWSPYIPRNVIAKYSKPGEIVLDYFVGAGTTAVEAKLLGRRCIARDINPGAVGMTVENLKFSPPADMFADARVRVYEPEVAVGDATDLSEIAPSSIDLICAHPPYAGIIKYSANIPGDLSDLPLEGFLTSMGKVAHESFRVLKPGGKCAILIGDARKSKHVVPIGFRTIRAFLDAGFSLSELIIKRQHNCKTTGFWYKRSIQYNFLLLAHEYLPVFEKPQAESAEEQVSSSEHALRHQATEDVVPRSGPKEIETTTVWVFPEEEIDKETRRNLLARFAEPGSPFFEFAFDETEHWTPARGQEGTGSLVYVRAPAMLADENEALAYVRAVANISDQAAKMLSSDGFLVVEAKDVRTGEGLWPMGLLLWEELSQLPGFAIKEIVIVVAADRTGHSRDSRRLDIVHRYLLVYSKKSPSKSNTTK